MKKMLLILSLSITACNQAQMQNFARGMQNYGGQSQPGQIDWGSGMRSFGNAYTGTTVQPPAQPIQKSVVPMVQPQKAPVSYNQIGNTTYGSDGTSYQRIGNTVYGSDGTQCSEIGTTVYCN